MKTHTYKSKTFLVKHDSYGHYYIARTLNGIEPMHTFHRTTLRDLRKYYGY